MVTTVFFDNFTCPSNARVRMSWSQVSSCSFTIIPPFSATVPIVTTAFFTETSFLALRPAFTTLEYPILGLSNLNRLRFGCRFRSSGCFCCCCLLSCGCFLSCSCSFGSSGSFCRSFCSRGSLSCSSSFCCRRS